MGTQESLSPARQADSHCSMLPPRQASEGVCVFATGGEPQATTAAATGNTKLKKRVPHMVNCVAFESGRFLSLLSPDGEPPVRSGGLPRRLRPPVG
jgi:hypothetical protein